MKIILDDNYYIKNGYGTTYDLVYSDGKTVSKTDKSGNVTETEKTAIVGSNPIPLLIDEYIKIKINDNNEDSTITIKQYIDEYKSIRNNVLNIMKDEGIE